MVQLRDLLQPGKTVTIRRRLQPRYTITAYYVQNGTRSARVETLIKTDEIDRERAELSKKHKKREIYLEYIDNTSKKV